MTRTAAREIAVHFAFELGFTNQTAEELLAEALNRKTFEQIGEEEPLYAEFPNEKQREYISKLVKGVYEHSPELDEYISKYAIGWKYSRLNRVAIAIMRVAMYEIDLLFCKHLSTIPGQEIEDVKLFGSKLDLCAVPDNTAAFGINQKISANQRGAGRFWDCLSQLQHERVGFSCIQRLQGVIQFLRCLCLWMLGLERIAKPL